MVNNETTRIINSERGLLNISNNKRCNIENININLDSTTMYNNIQRMCVPETSKLTNMKLSKKKVFDTALSGQIYLNDKLEELTKHVTSEYIEPIVRIWQLYSGFCTTWDRSVTDDLPMLELQEKDYLMNLVKKGCEFRIIIQLDVDLAIATGSKKKK